MHKLNQAEIDFIEFMAQKKNESIDYVKKVFLETKQIFNFGGNSYRKLCRENYKLYRILYDDKDENETLDAYRFHALMHIFRFLSYSDNFSVYENFDYYFKNIFIIFMGWIKRILKIILGFITSKNFDAKSLTRNEAINFLSEKIHDDSVLIDYGCGFGYISFELGRRFKNLKVYLVDIDCLVSDFVRFRFKKHEINFDFIPVAENNLYPKLPPCDICIAQEVLEHLHDPLIAFENIKESVKKGGILYGNFYDHEEFMFHVSPNLKNVRLEVEKYFKKIGSMIYSKK